MADSLKQNFEYFISHHDELVKLYNGKFVVIKDERVIGNYDDEMEAINETQKEHPLGTFLVQLCTPGEQSYTQTFHSRVAFA